MIIADYALTSGSADLLTGATGRRYAVTATETPRRGQLTDWAAVREFLFGGRAVFTLQAAKTGERYTYRVKVKRQDVKDGKTGPDLTYFIETLRGPDNTTDYRYLGVLRQPGVAWLTDASQQRRESASARWFVRFTERLREGRTGVLGTTLEFWHEGRCAMCGRALTVPGSVEDGVGPECRKRRSQ